MNQYKVKEPGSGILRALNVYLNPHDHRAATSAYIDSEQMRSHKGKGRWSHTINMLSWPKRVREARSEFEPLGIAVDLESDKATSIQSIRMRPKSLTSTVAYAEHIRAGSQKKINHYIEEKGLVYTAIHETVQRKLQVIRIDQVGERLLAYESLGALRSGIDSDIDTSGVNVDLGGYRVDYECLILAIHLILDGLKQVESAGLITTFSFRSEMKYHDYGLRISYPDVICEIQYQVPKEAERIKVEL